MNRVVEYIIRAKDTTATALRTAMANVKHFAAGVGESIGRVFSKMAEAGGKIRSFAAGIGRNLVNIQAGFNMLAGAARKAWSLLQKSFQFEKMTWQFKTLIGNLDDARTHMEMLQRLGDTPPFSMEEFAAASREMMKFSDGVLGFKDSLELVGDAAAALGTPVENLATLVGRAYALIRDGQPIARAGMMLRNVGAVTPEVVARLQEMEKNGASNIEMWSELEASLGRFKGAMKDTEQTADGLMGAIESQWDDAVRTFGEAFLNTAKGGMQTLLETMKQLNEDGSIEEWADKTADALKEVGGAMKATGAFFGTIWKGIKATVGTAMAFGAGADEAFRDDKGFMEQVKWGAAVAGKYWNSIWNDEDEDEDERMMRSERKREVAAQKARRKAKKEAEAEEMAMRKREQLVADMAAKEEEKQAALAEKQYREELEEYYKMLDEEEQARRQMMEQLEREEIEAERRRHQVALKNAQEEAQASEQAQYDAQSRLAAAQAAVSKAWGWYKDRASMQAEIDAYNEQKAAEVQFEKDFERLKDRHRDWRDIEFGKLSADEEAVRQVALAKEEARAAQVALDEIVENTAYLKSIAESLTAEEGA